jgi:hypothetical protein
MTHAKDADWNVHEVDGSGPVIWVLDSCELCGEFPRAFDTFDGALAARECQDDHITGVTVEKRE